MKSENIDLASYVDRLIEEKKLPSYLEKEVVDQMKKDLLDRLEDRINSVIIMNLSSEKLEESIKMLEDETKDEVLQKFYSDNIPNLPELIASELISFKQSYLS